MISEAAIKHAVYFISIVQHSHWNNELTLPFLFPYCIAKYGYSVTTTA